MLFKLHFLSGDLLYIDVVTLEDVQVNITASTGGFFVNRLVLLMYIINKNSNDNDVMTIMVISVMILMIMHLLIMIKE